MKLKKRISEMYLIVIAVIVDIAAVVLTIEFGREDQIPFLAAQRDRMISAEIALFGIIIVESFTRLYLKRLKQRESMQAGVVLRSAFRMISYSIIAITIVSILSANQSLVISVGTVTGIVVGFSTQNIIGNVIAGTLLAFMRPVRIGDEITVLGNTGNLMEIGVIYTVVDSGEKLVLIPNVAMLTTAIQRKKNLADK